MLVEVVGGNFINMRVQCFLDYFFFRADTVHTYTMESSTLYITNNQDLANFVEIAKQYLNDGFYLRLMFQAYAPTQGIDKNTELSKFRPEEDGNSSSSTSSYTSTYCPESQENIECSQLY